MIVRESAAPHEHLALFSRSTMIGVAVVALAAISDGDLSRSWILALLGTGGAVLVYSLVTALLARRHGRAITAFILLSITVALPLLRIWTGESPVRRTPRSLFEKGFDFE